ncbi:xanthine dehydrogenase small subunit [Coralliovum pocilloporae]|uniref:xanthine dehydrogenase small subunit n=1 Tax=Coralliovum pocilloporae TaxID=3066369 RepID=UPI003306AA84
MTTEALPIRREIRFLLNGRDVSLSDVPASRTVLDFLRLDQRLTGSKEGCAEGDCGACTVLVGSLKNGALCYETVNACIRFLASLDGCHVVTIEHLRGSDGSLHPVQQAMVDEHGSQCGFCTPGFVMSLYALWMEQPEPSLEAIETALQGNLCRCTGYEPIIRAAHAISRYGTPASDALEAEREAVRARLEALRDGARVVTGPEDNQAILPADVDDFAAAYQQHPEATIVAGATDVGLWVTKFLRPISPAIFIGHLDGLRQVSLIENTLTLGAGLSYTDSQAALTEHVPHLEAYWKRIAGWQVRNMGTIGGNIANGSPIGDTPPVLIALRAELSLRKGDHRRRMPLEDFFIDYGKQDRQPGEFVEAVHIPLPSDGQIDAAYKISKRRDEDISSVAMGLSVSVENGTITDCRIACGGMAATPKRANEAEQALLGQPWSEATFEAAAVAIARDYTPLDDWRASSDYRMMVTQNLIRRFWLEHGDDAKGSGSIRLSA